ncbi:uncharacterized protein si:ch211-281l24.3 isoform X43 [Labeo rohita]|uniref:uncharacterized protein si:ch211-281l24.3 isoform X43 n=1 Tax=Labeo rohita TaxID=84645 RepID=UPI0021E29C90|nr:uncharacterized protein si:ch211-281l24.3 isoform X43 [Labeo rohita]
MDTQDSEEDVGTMKCERLRPDKETSPSPSVTTLQSDQSLDLQVLFKDGSQSFLGIKRSRQGQSTSPAPSVTSLQSDQSLDRPILFKDGAQSKKRRKSQRLRPDKGTSPAPSCTSLQSNESMDRPILFKDRTQSKERLRPDKGTSPAPSCTSLQSNESMDRPILFKDGTQSKERLRPDKGTSPAPSCTSLQSNESMDRPILFKDGTQSKKRLRPDKGTSPAPSCTSLQSNESMDRPILFKDRTQSKKRLRPDKGTSPAPSCTSLQSNESMDRPILFKDRTQSKKRLRPDKGTSPAPSCTSLQSNESMDRPILFKDGTQSIERLRPDKGTSPAPSCTSLQSNESMDRPILFKDGTQSKERLRPDKGTSPAPSCTSLQSNESMDRPILFKDGTQSSESIPEKNAEEPFDRHISFRNDTLSPDISTLSVTLLTEDHYRCSVCTEVLKDPVSIPCGHSYCKHCIESYWSKPTYGESYACPQCRKSFSSPPVLNVNVALAKVIKELLQAGFSPALPAHCYAGPKDVPCDICTEMKLKAVKTCLTCTASYCETHIRQHYSVPALQRHNLVEAIHLPDKEERKSPDEFGELTARVTELEATSKRLCKRFEIHCNDFPSDVIEMAALGHPLSLGMLYDSQKKSFCQGIFMWDEDTLARMKVSLPRPQTYVKVLENDSLQERFRVLEMSPVLQGVQTGQIKVSGASAFLNHPEQSQHQERATLHYRTTTRLDMLSQRLLQEAVPSALVGQTTATHVIIAVFFGAQAFFVFDGDRSNHEKNAAIVDVLKIMTSTFCPNHIISNLSATEKAKSSLLACSLYIDVGDWKSPVSFDKAVEVYGSLPTLLGSKDEQAVPLKVWLYPLKKLNKISMCAALSGVSENLIQRAESIMEHLRKQIRICQDIIKDYIHVNVIMQSQTLEDKLVGFLELLQEYQTTFQKGITDIVHIKEGKREKSLQDLLKRHSQSPFSAEKTDQWLENKETELKILNDFRAANITVVKSQAELQQIISHSQKTRVMCLTLYSPDVEDYFLTALRQYIESDHVIQNDSLQFRPVSISDKEIIKVQMFIAANEDAEQTKFIAALVTSDDFPEYSVQFYRDGRIASRNVTLGTKSGLVQISNIKHTSVSLKLNQPEPKRIERYVVEYRALGDDGSNSNTWKQIVFDAKIITETCMISDLKPGHQYQLRYIFVEQDCMNFSRIGNFTTVVAATPGKPLVNKLDRDTLKVTWLRAETDQDFPVLRYNVEYKEAGLEGWPSVQTEGPECECTLTVLHSTCYRVRVSAVYEDITSQPSEETPVPVDVWNINLSKRKSSILLEVLKLQTEKKPVELIDWTDEESEVKGYLQCLPYISQLRFRTHMKREPAVKFLLNLIVSASEFKENCTELLTSVCSYTFFPYNEGYYSQAQCDFLLDLCSHVKDYETQTGRSVLPALQPIYQSALTVWIIDLSERKSSILLEVLKLQTEKKPVELIDWTDEESEVKGFLQCLPYISQLRFDIDNFEREPAVKLLLKLIVSASEFDAIKGENYTELLTSVCSYTSFPFNEDYFDDSEYQIDQCNFLLDLCSHMKNYETRTDRSVLPALQPIYQSAPAVWIIDLSERKSSILLEVLKLQTEKKPVKLIDWTDEESEVKGFLQCLPYISQLRIHESDFSYESAAQFLLNLTVAASKCVTTTGENFIELLTSVCSYKSFLCYDDDDIYDDCQNEHCDFLLDLCSHVKDYETQTGSSVLPALQPIYQSAPAVWRIKLSERKSSILLEVLKLQTEKKPVELIDWTDEESEVKGFLQCLPYISQLRFVIDNFEREPAVKFLLKLIVSASEFDAIKGESYTELLTSVCSYTFFPNIECNYYNKNHQINQSDFLLDLYSHVKDYDSQTGRSVLPALQPIYQSAPAVWRIKLSERKSSILLEVLKLQTEKKPVVLIDWTDDESEVKGFLQCLPYISQLRFNLYALSHFERKSSVQFLANLVISALEFDKDTSENYTELLTSVCSYTSFPCSENYTNHQCNFLLDLYSHVKDYETQTGRSVLPALQPIYQSAPAVWSINLSERKSSILLEVLKLQTEKKPVELIDWTDEESEVKGFLQCLPYISQLRFDSLVFKKKKRSVQFLGNLIISASEFHKTTGENYTELFTSMCSYTSFPCSENNTNYHTDQCDFLLDLYSHVKDYESQTGRSVLPALQPIYQSAPAVWRIKLSERKSSILLEVLKLQTEKKPVVLIDWTDDESEVKGFLQCLPYISQLRFNLYALSHFERKSSVQFLANLVISALEFDKDTSENYTELLTSVCSYTSFPCSENYTNHQCNFLLDLYSHVKDYETQTGRSVLPALQPIYQSAPAVWSINLSERKSSILLEVLKLQTEKKPVELIDWTDEESEVKGFLQCLPYISQLRFDSLVFKKKKRSVQFLRNLIISASEFDKTTGENNTELFTSMCSYTSFPCSENNTNCHTDQCDFLLDLYSHVKDYESQTGRSVLPALQPIYQSAPAVWIIKLSERKSSILLEVLKLQTEKKPVELIDWTDEESKVKGFLQCLPYISQLRPSKEALQQLVSVVYDAQDDELTDCFLKVSEDLTSCSLTWDVIHYLLQHQALNLKVDFRKSKISCENIRKLLPLLDRIQLKRLSPSFTLSIILEIYETRFPQYVSSLMSSAGNDINLNGRVLDYVHCAALRFILEHCDTVKLNLLWTSIAEGELESFLPLLSKVKQLSVDRLLLLKLLHCCSSSDLQQEAADVLLSALQNRLDFSCCSALDLTDTQENQEHFQTN